MEPPTGSEPGAPPVAVAPPDGGLANSCVTKAVIGGVAGYGLGGLMGMFFTPMADSSNLAVTNLPFRQQMRRQFQDMGRKSNQQGKMFGKIGAMFSMADCIVEKYRGRHDVWNGTISGCIVGGILAVRGGPSATLMGAAGFGAFSLVADSVMHGFMGEKPDPKIAKKEKEEELALAAEIPPSIEELQLLVERKTVQTNAVQW